MRNKGIGTVTIVIVIVVAAAAAGGYMVMSGDGSDDGGNGPTNGGEGLVWSDISSLDFEYETVDEDGNIVSEGSMMIKGIGTSQRKIKTTNPGCEEGCYEIVIVNEEIEKAWVYRQDNWNSVENIPDTDYETFQKNTENIVNEIENMFSGWSKDENITIQNESGSTTRLYNIEVNVDFSNSLFEDPTS